MSLKTDGNLIPTSLNIRNVKRSVLLDGGMKENSSDQPVASEPTLQAKEATTAAATNTWGVHAVNAIKEALENISIIH